jgi:hypothetical protein
VESRSVGTMGLPKFLQYSNTSNSHLAVDDKDLPLVRA